MGMADTEPGILWIPELYPNHYNTIVYIDTSAVKHLKVMQTD
jgi:hypothetical protein